MENNDKKYEVILNNSVNILKVFSIIGIILLVLVCLINQYYNISRVWNISFLIPIFVIFFSSIIELIICFWNIGNVKPENIEVVCKRKSRLIFSSCITYLVFLGSSFMYILLSIILY